MPSPDSSSGTPSRNEQIQAWLVKAAEDTAVVELIFAAGNPWALAVYHCQQAAEKHLKAAHVAVGLAPPRTHDLGSLLHIAAFDGIVPSDVLRAAETLTGYAWLTRYPDGPETTSKTAVRAKEAYEMIREWSLSYLTNFAPEVADAD